MKAIAAISQIEQLVRMALESRDIQTKGIPRSIRFPEELDARMTTASEMLDCDRTEIAVRCVQKSFQEVIGEMITERSKKAAEYLTSGGGPHVPCRRRSILPIRAARKDHAGRATEMKPAIRRRNPNRPAVPQRLWGGDELAVLKAEVGGFPDDAFSRNT